MEASHIIYQVKASILWLQSVFNSSFTKPFYLFIINTCMIINFSI